MKNPLKLLLLTLGTVACTLPLIQAEDTTPAPAGGPPAEHREEFGRHGKERGDRIFKELGLTADQQAKMKAFGEEQKAAAEALRADTSLTSEQKKEKRTQIWQDFKTKREAVLTPEQKKKADEMREKFKEHRRQHEQEDKPDAAK